ncbi:putative transcriptional regulator, TetR family [Streptomyces venezuelae]|uniref:TetR/AcrR family transcriptional regulator n=1 Tax=Streptomyces gardneri TaxID=66892 RepID=UPI0006BC59FA|nr:TetR/AcrR family transcriptional regulator [Streptomyces gardneri]ALO07535.1 putative transcriptional regulator, TetR family [Streptomyces venezuelae]QPK44850.1 TetR/AcrR family transcriptional regulator [Streptomyces gardneri]WRK36163.1 TetR/AcrR family transcriptional regulator [Streptomyces venezuelae]CUM42140.1 transcriptional regulator, TetR family [Streptomyces venezuelae]
MGQKGTETRDRLLDATQELVETAGYFGTGLNQVIAVSGAPRGSLYFHFPGGKDQLVGESVRRAGQAIGDALGEPAGTDPSPAEFVEGVLRHLGDRLAESGWRKGCPVATVALETAAANDPLQEVCSEVYSSWEAALRARLSSRPDADDLAVTVLALVEGALLLARAHRSRDPLERVARRLHTLLG